MARRHCSDCLTDWPASAEFGRCPECQVQTIYRSTGEPDIDVDEATRRLMTARFERFYANREATRKRRGETSPEVLGRLEARRQIRALRELQGQLETVAAQ